jgi:hypothetical protein
MGGRVAADNFGDDSATIDLGAEESLVLDRKSATATFVSPVEVDDGRLVHPVLATVGAVFAWWRGHLVFHGGAVVIGDGAWGLLGVRGSGKSSMLARLALSGHQVLTDDVLVAAHGSAMAGPRGVDLREETVHLLDLTDRTDLVRAGRRKRLPLPPVSPEVPLRGWIVLDWGDEIRIEALGPTERIESLGAHRVALHPARFLDMGSLPAWRLTRPPEWRSLEPAVERVVEIATS